MYPRDTYKIIDNTFKKSTASSVNTGLVYLQPFISSKGEDGVLRDFDNYEDFIAEFGTPRFSAHGQAYYQAAALLQSRNAIVKGMRLTATNAVYANIMVCLEIKKGSTQKTDAKGNLVYLDSNGEETLDASSGIMATVATATVGLTLKKLKPSGNRISVKQQILAAFTSDESTGTYCVPLFLLKAKGKGGYGNGYKFRLISTPKSDKFTNFRNYGLSLTYTESGVTTTVFNNRPITLCDNAINKNNGLSLNIEDVLNNKELPIEAIVHENMFNFAINILDDVLQRTLGESYDRQAVDLINFLDANGDLYEGITIDPTSVDLSLSTGIAFKNGSDGDFDETNTNRENAINKRLIEFYSGQIDNTILYSTEHQWRIALDANYPQEVKESMVKLVNERKDFVAILDLTILTKEAEVGSLVNSIMSYDNKLIYINTQNYSTFDPYTGKNIQVTANYLWAKLFPLHVANFGYHVPFAGVNAPLDAYINEGSLQPLITDKSFCYDDLRSNYIHKEAGKLVFGTNCTTQQKESELLYLNNVLVFLAIQEDIKELGSQFRWQFSGTDNDYTTLNKVAKAKLNKYLDQMIKEGDITIEPSLEKKRALCKLQIVFREFILGTDFEFYIELDS